jgi:hypothetical protein
LLDGIASFAFLIFAPLRLCVRISLYSGTRVHFYQTKPMRSERRFKVSGKIQRYEITKRSHRHPALSHPMGDGMWRAPEITKRTQLCLDRKFQDFRFETGQAVTDRLYRFCQTNPTVNKKRQVTDDGSIPDSLSV